MTDRFSSSRALAAPLALMLALAGCGHGAPQAPQPVSAAPAPVSIEGVIALLDKGDQATASKQLKTILKRDPTDSAARVLEESIDKDPVELLGPKAFSYTVQPGETMIQLAERFLGTKLKFYQLARYNGIQVPASLAAGTELRIPGTAPRAPEPVRTAPRAPAPATRPTRAKPAGAPAAAAPAAPVANPALASQLRGAGLAALNQGKVDRAVALLSRAAALDPGNPLIARDLSRAQRIQRTVSAHH
jgi:hypothetical protein